MEKWTAWLNGLCFQNSDHEVSQAESPSSQRRKGTFGEEREGDSSHQTQFQTFENTGLKTAEIAALKLKNRLCLRFLFVYCMPAMQREGGRGVNFLEKNCILKNTNINIYRIYNCHTLFYLFCTYQQIYLSNGSMFLATQYYYTLSDKEIAIQT